MTQHMPRMTGYREGHGRIEIDPQFGGDNRIVVSGGPRRAGIYGARIATTHVARLPFDVGPLKKGDKFRGNVLSLVRQEPAVRQHARWVCAHPECTGKSWETRAEAHEGHPEDHKLRDRGEGHCLIAVAKVPERRGKVIQVFEATNPQGGAITLIKVDCPHGIDYGSLVEVVDVRGRQMLSVGTSEGLEVQQKIANLIALNRKDEANKLLSLSMPEAPVKGDGGNKHELLSCNGKWAAFSHSVDTIMIACKLSGSFVRSGDPHVILSPESPLLLSDEE